MADNTLIYAALALVFATELALAGVIIYLLRRNTGPAANVIPRYRGYFLFPEENGIAQHEEITAVSRAFYRARMWYLIVTAHCSLATMRQDLEDPNGLFNLVWFGGHAGHGIVQLDDPDPGTRDLFTSSGVIAPVGKRLATNTEIVEQLLLHRVEIVIANACNTRDLIRQCASANMIGIGTTKAVKGVVAAYFGEKFMSRMMEVRQDPWTAFYAAREDVNARYPGDGDSWFILPEMPRWGGNVHEHASG